MARPSFLPPQAYTVETLKEAYSWLQSQPPSIRELARSDNDIVSLFKQYQRRQAGIQSEAFKVALQKLAQGFEEFDSQDEARSPVCDQEKAFTDSPQDVLGDSPSSPSSVDSAASPSSPQEKVPLGGFPQQKAPLPSSEERPRAPQGVSMESSESSCGPSSPYTVAPAKTPPVRPPSLFLGPDLTGLDEKTRRSLQIVREQLNLGSTEEALRVLVVLGLEKLKETLPNKF